MKKLFLFILAAGALTTSFAQSRHDRDESRDVVLGPRDNHNDYGSDDRRYDRTNSYNNRSALDARINDIKRNYNARIWDVQNNRWLRNGEKRHQVRALEAQRDDEIRRVVAHYNNRNDVYYNDRNNRRY